MTDSNFTECAILANDAINELTKGEKLVDYVKAKYKERGRGYIHFSFDSKDQVREFLRIAPHKSYAIARYYIFTGFEHVGNESLVKFVTEYDPAFEYIVAVSIKCPTEDDTERCAFFPVKMEKVYVEKTSKNTN